MKSPLLPLPPVLHILFLYKKLFHFIEHTHTYTQHEYKSFNWIEYLKYFFRVQLEEEENTQQYREQNDSENHKVIK